MKIKNVLPVLAMISLLSCSQKKNNDSEKIFNDPLLYSKTVKKLNEVVLENNFPPMIASRNYAYANVAAYETMVLGDSRFQSLAGQIKHLKPLTVTDTRNVNFHYAALLAFCRVGESVTFPEGSMQQYVDKLDSIAENSGMSQEMKTASKKLADMVSNHILQWSKGDHYAETRSASRYTITNEEGSWVPTPPSYTQAVEPHWREIRTMVLDSSSQFMPPRPPVFDVKNKNSVYYKFMLEVMNIGNNLTDEQKHIAEFWDDNPYTMNVSGHVMFVTKKFSPPGHWMNIVGIGAKKAGADFGTTVAAYAETAITLFDAFISSWDEKFRSNLVRPETVINKYVDQLWRPHIQTPPFPTYTSAHATNSAAAAEVMSFWFGDNLSFADTSLLEFGIKSRVVKSFREAAKEAAMSRLYGGIHYRFDNDEGNKAGTKLGEYILSRLRLKK